MMTLHRFGLLVAGLLLVASCGYVETNEVAAPRVPKTTVSGAGGGGVSFANDVLPIFTTHCGECHNPSSRLGGLDFSAYSGVAETVGLLSPGDAEGSLIVQVLEEGRMPPGGRTGPSEEELAVLKSWITAGAPNN